MTSDERRESRARWRECRAKRRAERAAREQRDRELLAMIERPIAHYVAADFPWPPFDDPEERF
jgi:hypothetical protein